MGDENVMYIHCRILSDVKICEMCRTTNHIEWENTQKDKDWLFSPYEIPSSKSSAITENKEVKRDYCRQGKREKNSRLQGMWRRKLEGLCST